MLIILSIIAEGGVGKSALVNNWLVGLRERNYAGAEVVLGWSFYSQGSKERITSSDELLSWLVEKLNVQAHTTTASAKAEAIAEAMSKRRVLLILDGVEPLQHGPGPREGQLKDIGLRSLLRRFAAVPPAEPRSFIVLTGRLAIKDIARWGESAAPVMDLGMLSDEAGADLLRDNGVRGTDSELRAAARDFDGHPLALDLLAGFLKECHYGDIRRRDHIRGLLRDPQHPGYDHARRVIESYEKEWLLDRPVLREIMWIIGLFDRPASGNCLHALRKKPPINGLTNQVVSLNDAAWNHAAAQLRAVVYLPPKMDSSLTLSTHIL